jgi:hypothetical protein
MFTNSIITAGGREIDLNSLPEKSVLALLRRGATHFFGSEIASRVKTKKDNHEGDPTDEQIAAWKSEFVAEFHAKLAEGTIGDRAVGQSVDPLEAEMERIAKQEVKDTLRANGIKVPTKGEALRLGGNEVTLDELVERRLTAHGERIEKDAKKAIAAREKQRNALKVAEVKSVEDLGL